MQEAAQEAGSQVLTNIVAANTYDQTRKFYDDVVESGAIGGIVGASMSSVASTIREKRESGNITPEEDNQLS